MNKITYGLFAGMFAIALMGFVAAGPVGHSHQDGVCDPHHLNDQHIQNDGADDDHAKGPGSDTNADHHVNERSVDHSVQEDPCK